jgi:PEGA domain
VNRVTSLLIKALIATAMVLVATCGEAAAQGYGGGAWGGGFSVRPFVVPPFVVPPFRWSGYGASFLGAPQLPPPYPYMPKYWWVSPYSIEDPRQSGYNPSAGYRWEDVTTLILATYPKQADVILDGNPIGSSDDLGPIQLPFGVHTLRVQSPGYEPSETVVKVETPSLQRLQVNLKSVARPPASSR